MRRFRQGATKSSAGRGSQETARETRELLEVITDGFVAVDRSFRITHLNGAGERSSGTDRSQALGKSLWEGCPALRGTRLEDKLRGAMKDRRSAELQHFHKQNQRWFIVRAHPNENQGLWIFFHDITAAKQQEIEIQTVHQRAFEILQSINDGFFALDDRWRFTYVNGRAELYLQKTSKDLLGRVIWEAFPNLDGGRMLRELRTALEQRRRLRFVADSLAGTCIEFDVHACAGGACVYFRRAGLGRRKSARSQIFADDIIWAEEQERQRIARELHDSVGQLLVSLTLGLRNLADLNDQRDMKVRARRLRAIASRVAKELAHLTHGLHGSELRDLGLVPALRQLVHQVADMYGIKVSFKTVGAALTDMELASQVALYRIVQEALTNVAKHADATHVMVSVQGNAAPGQRMVAEIRDNGKGFRLTKNENSAHHLGLRSMRERVALLGGTLIVRSTPGRGTSVRLTIPAHAKTSWPMDIRRPA